MPDKTGLKSFPLHAIGGTIGLIALFLLAGCVSGSNNAISPSKEKSEQSNNDNFVDLRAYCPKIAVRLGAGTMRVYPKGVKRGDDGADQKLRFQASIREFTRECNYVDGRLAIRLGVAGIAINGPMGETGLLKLPVRVSVNRGNTILYSRIIQISTVLEEGKSRATFRLVDEDINIEKPERKNLLINIGFDEGAS